MSDQPVIAPPTPPSRHLLSLSAGFCGPYETSSDNWHIIAEESEVQKDWGFSIIRRRRRRFWVLPFFFFKS